MIDLLSIKLNGDYDYIQNTVPSANGTWLCSGDLTGYTKGFSYRVVTGSGGSITRIEAKQDYKALTSIYSVIEATCEYLNNYFPVKRQDKDLISTDEYGGLTPRENKELTKYLSTYGNYLLKDNEINGVQQVFLKDDLIRLSNAIRNNYITYITAVNGDVITVDNPLFSETLEDCRISLIKLPLAVEMAISEMIYYNVFLRDKPSNLQSETIGNYSYTKAKASIGGLDYPPEIIGVLDQYKIVRFV